MEIDLNLRGGRAPLSSFHSTDTAVGELGISRQSDFKSSVQFAEMIQLVQCTPSLFTEQKIAKLANKILINTQAQPYDKKHDRKNIVDTFHHLLINDKLTALKVYRKFLCTDVLDADTLRSYLYLPSRRMY